MVSIGKKPAPSDHESSLKMLPARCRCAFYTITLCVIKLATFENTLIMAKLRTTNTLIMEKLKTKNTLIMEKLRTKNTLIMEKLRTKNTLIKEKLRTKNTLIMEK